MFWFCYPACRYSFIKYSFNILTPFRFYLSCQFLPGNKYFYFECLRKKIIFYFFQLALEQNSASVGPLVFGADLQSIVEREKSKFGIPSLVHSCIEEVEERGMQVGSFHCFFYWLKTVFRQFYQVAF